MTATQTSTTDDGADAQDTPELAEFRKKCRAFLQANAKKRQQPKPGTEDEDEAPTAMEGGNVEANKRFQAALYDAGLAGITWPKEVGGQGLSNDHQRVFNEEAADYELLTGVYTIGLGSACSIHILEKAAL